MYQGSHFIEVMGVCILMAGEKFNDHSVMKSVYWDIIIGFLTKCWRGLMGMLTLIC